MLITILRARTGGGLKKPERHSIVSSFLTVVVVDNKTSGGRFQRLDRHVSPHTRLIHA